MRRVASVIFVMAMMHLGATSEAQKAVSPAKNVPAAAKTDSKVRLGPASVGGQLADFIGKKARQGAVSKSTAKATQASKPMAEDVAATKAPNTGTKPTLTASSALSSGKSAYVPPPPTASAPQIRQEIQKIIELNNRIKKLQAGKTAQLQRIQEQARIHQKILDELEKSKVQKTELKTTDKEALLAQEKLRIIHEETQKNAQSLQALKDQSQTSETSSTAKTEKTPSA